MFCKIRVPDRMPIVAPLLFSGILKLQVLVNNVSVLLYIYFPRWLHPLLRLGHKKELQIEDLHRVLDGDKSERLGDDLER